MNEHVPGRALQLIRLVATAWLTVWLGLITLNNITDFGTNEALIRQMFEMRPLLEDPVRGNGLEWRALPGGLAAAALVGVILYEAFIVVLLARSLPAGVRALRGAGRPQEFTRRANRGLAAALVLPAGFLAGGMWFGYWLFMGQVQQVHLTLLIIVSLVAVLVNVAGERTESPATAPAERLEAPVG
ncbi:DUF2165 family protein [Actinosynnema sp. NPDC059797]